MQCLCTRYYNPSTGRFNRMDPFAGNTQDPQSLHKYAYAHANPVMGVDPSGLVSLSELGIANTLQNSLQYSLKFATSRIVKRAVRDGIANAVLSAAFRHLTGESTGIGDILYDFGTGAASSTAGSFIGKSRLFNALEDIPLKSVLKLSTILTVATRGALTGIVAAIIVNRADSLRGKPVKTEEFITDLMIGAVFGAVFDNLGLGLESMGKAIKGRGQLIMEVNSQILEPIDNQIQFFKSKLAQLNPADLSNHARLSEVIKLLEARKVPYTSAFANGQAQSALGALIFNPASVFTLQSLDSFGKDSSDAILGQ